MFNQIFGKGSPTRPPEHAVHRRGIEVLEDDPDTAWSRWDEALANQESRLNALEPLPDIGAQTPSDAGETDEPTRPMGLEDLTPQQRLNRALLVVETHHRRIANTIRTLWGYRECSLYINKLIMEGEDGKGHARAGFNQEAAAAMIQLTHLHDELFGVFTPRDSTAFGDLSMHTDWNGLR